MELYNPRFKSYLSYKFDQPEPICDQTKMNLAGVRRLSRNYFEPCNYTFNYYALNDIKININASIHGVPYSTYCPRHFTIIQLIKLHKLSKQ